MGFCCSKKKPPEEEVAKHPSGAAHAHPLDGQDDEDLRAVFQEFDINNDGTISMPELKQVMIKMGQNPTEEDVKAMFESADKNGDGRIDFEEFVAISKANPLGESLTMVFAELDADGDGFLTKKEIKEAFERMGHPLAESQISIVFDEVDVDKDGKINCKEFISIMSKNKK